MTVSLLGIVKLRRWTFLQDIREQTWHFYKCVGPKLWKFSISYHNSKYFYLVKYQNRIFSHFIIIISLTWWNLPLLRILQKQVNSEFWKISSFSSKRRIFSYDNCYAKFHAFCKSAPVFCLSKMHIVCYVLHAKFDVLTIIHVILLNIPDNYDKI